MYFTCFVYDGFVFRQAQEPQLQIEDTSYGGFESLSHREQKGGKKRQKRQNVTFSEMGVFFGLGFEAMPVVLILKIFNYGKDKWNYKN